MKILTVFLILIIFLVNPAHSQDNNVHKFKAGLSLGISLPNKVLSYPTIVGFKGTALFEVRTGKYSNIYYTLSSSSYEPDNKALIEHYPLNGTNKVVSYNKSNPFKMYTFALGYALSSSSSGRESSIRGGLGLYLDYSREDEIYITFKDSENSVKKLTLKPSDKYSIGLNFRVGADLPIYKDIFGLSADIDFNSGLIGVPSVFDFEGLSAVIGFYLRV